MTEGRERNGGDVVVETLTALGVTHVFGIPGQHALGLFDAIRRSDLEFVSSRVANNSAFGADGYARATGKPAVMFVSTGPGALTALGVAAMVLLAFQRFEHEPQREWLVPMILTMPSLCVALFSSPIGAIRSRAARSAIAR